LAEVVEDVVEIGEIDGGGAVEVAGGPGGGGGAEVGEDEVEIVEVNGAGEVGVSEEFGADEEGVGVDGKAAEGGEGGGKRGVVDEGEGGVGGEGGAQDAGGVGFAIVDLRLEGGEDGGLGGGGGFDDEAAGGEVKGGGRGDRAVERERGEFEGCWQSIAIVGQDGGGSGIDGESAVERKGG
jgi:hypothetical protein